MDPPIKQCSEFKPAICIERNLERSYLRKHCSLVGERRRLIRTWNDGTVLCIMIPIGVHNFSFIRFLNKNSKKLFGGTYFDSFQMNVSRDLNNSTIRS